MQPNYQFSVSSKPFISTLENIEISKDRIFHFQEPIFGFESIKKYAFMPSDNLPSDQGYFTLHSLEGENVSFIIYAVPFIDLVPDLQNKLNIFIEHLGLDVKNIVVAHFVIVDKEKPKGSRISLSSIAPLLFCCKSNNAWQVIIE